MDEATNIPKKLPLGLKSVLNILVSGYIPFYLTTQHVLQLLKPASFKTNDDLLYVVHGSRAVKLMIRGYIAVFIFGVVYNAVLFSLTLA